MQAVLSSAFELASSHQWLVTANLILSVLLGLWMLRYRRLYVVSRMELANTDELIENLSEGIYRSLPSGKQVRANQALVRLNGYGSEAEMLAGVRDIAREWYVDPNRRAEFKHLLERDGKVVDFVSEIFRHKSRERIWVTESARLVRDKSTGKVRYYEGSVREITETVKRLKLEEQFSKLMREVPGCLFQCTVSPDAPSVIDYLSPGFERLSGIPASAQLANWRAFLDRVPDEDRSLYAVCFGFRGGSPQPFDIEHRYTCPQGTEKWIRVSATPEIRGSAVIWHGYMSDVTLRKNNQLAVEHLAYFDTLTGLPNRRAFLDRMAQAVKGCETGGRGALLFIDLDNFKSLNDTQGHDIGDQYLVLVAQRLQQNIGAGDLVARIGGDEFVVLVAEAGRDEGSATHRAITLGNRLIAAMREPFALGTLNHRASASVGVVVFDGTGAQPDEILKRADVAMYEAKSSGRDSLAIYDPVSMNREAERYRLLADLRDTLGRDGDELELHFQPLMDGAGMAVAAEALIRWHHPRMGLVMPDRFIPLAEQFGLISEIGALVIARAVQALARWRSDAALSHLHLSVNLSVQCLQNEELPRYIAGLLAQHGVPGEALTIEVTENVLARDQALIARRMEALKALGVRLALDDFGTGYSSLTYLKTLPFDEVKIDGSFVADIETTESDRTLVKTILAMASTLGLVAVAERVETYQQEAFLRAHGCDRYQGWLYARAMPEAGFIAFASAIHGQHGREAQRLTA
jgi:diguanylate cyclase (GGDEF)-like protein/PAS domain S-box-containing protein